MKQKVMFPNLGGNTAYWISSYATTEEDLDIPALKAWLPVAAVVVWSHSEAVQVKETDPLLVLRVVTVPV